MHDELFEQPAVVARYRAGPYAESRERFLQQARAVGYSPATLESMAWALLVVAEAVHDDGGSVSYERLRSTLLRRVRLKSTARPPSANTAKLFLRCAKAWLRSIGALTPEAQRPLKFAGELRAFTEYMRVEQGLSPTTIAGRDEQIRWFCASLPSQVRSLDAVTLAHVDAFLRAQAQRGWSRRSLHTLGGSLRSFFRYAASQRWCRSDLASGIELPRLYALEHVPRAPSVEEVGRLLKDTASSDDPVNILDHAILSLLIYYGLRRSEVERLTLDDLDWVAEAIHVTRPKQRRAQYAPDEDSAGWPRQPASSLFAPCLVSDHPGAFPPTVGSQHHLHGEEAVDQAGVQLNWRGAHCLRHACASQLLDAGFTLKQIADHLGHRSMGTTRIYTKIDLHGLRQVAEIDLGALL